MKKRFAALISFIFIAICFMKVLFDTRYFKLEKPVFSSNKLPMNAKFTVLQISDLHNHVFGTDNEWLLSTAAAANPDVIVLTGDLIDRKTKGFTHVLSLVEQLTAINHRVFFVSGNHEWENSRCSEFLDGLQARNVTILNNQSTQIMLEDTTINLAGADDAATEHDDLEKAFSNVNNEYYTILLAHAPQIVKQYDTIPADLILSGHTHGGQIRFPIIGALVAPGQGLFPELDKGIYQLGPNQHLYIVSGLGTTRLPIRFLNQSQLSLITVQAGQ